MSNTVFPVFECSVDVATSSNFDVVSTIGSVAMLSMASSRCDVAGQSPVLDSSPPTSSTWPHTSSIPNFVSNIGSVGSFSLAIG